MRGQCVRNERKEKQMKMKEQYCTAGTHRVHATLHTVLWKTKISLRNSYFSIYHEKEVHYKNHKKEGLDIQSNRWVCSAQQCLHHSPPPPFFLRVLFCSENHLFDSKRCLPPDYWIMAKNKAAFSIQFPILEVGGWGLYIKIGNWCFCLKKEEKTPRIAKKAIQRETVVPLSFISFCNLPFCHAAYCKSRSWPLDPSCQDCPRTVYGWTGQDSRIIAIVL